MTIVQRDYWTISMSFKDDDGAVSRFAVNVYEPGVDVGFPVIKLYTDNLIPLVQAVSDGTYLEHSISKGYYENDPAEKVANPGSDVEDKGVMLFETADGSKGKLSVPSILESKLVSTGALAGIQLDMTDADVAALVLFLITDVDTTPFGLAGEVHAVDSRGSEYITIYDAYKQNVASYKSRGSRG